MGALESFASENCPTSPAGSGTVSMDDSTAARTPKRRETSGQLITRTVGRGAGDILRSLQPGEIDLCGSTRGLNRETLPRVASEPSENADEAEPFDTLGNDAQSKGVSEVDDRSDEVLLPRVCVTELEARRERTIQLDLADREVAQVRERREPGAEVINRHHDAHVRQALNDPLGSGQIRHDHPLGDLEDEGLGPQASPLEERAHSSAAVPNPRGRWPAD